MLEERIPVFPQLMEIKYNCQSQQTFRYSKTHTLNCWQETFSMGWVGGPRQEGFRQFLQKEKRKKIFSTMWKWLAMNLGCFTFIKFFAFYPLVPAPF